MFFLKTLIFQFIKVLFLYNYKVGKGMAGANLETIVEILNNPFYKKWDFWISLIVGGLGVGFSILAFIEAKAAKKAASDMAKTVKVQTITIELTEIIQGLDKLDYSLDFVTARDRLSEINRKLRRLLAPFQNSEDISQNCVDLKQALDNARSALDGLVPSDNSNDVPNAIYFGLQSHFGNISSQVAEILGLLEKRNLT